MTALFSDNVVSFAAAQRDRAFRDPFGAASLRDRAAAVAEDAAIMADRARDADVKAALARLAEAQARLSLRFGALARVTVADGPADGTGAPEAPS